MKKKRLVYVILTAAVCFSAIFIGYRKEHTASFLWKLFPTAEETAEGGTSTAYRYEMAFTRVLLQYPYFREMYRADYSTAIPGLENTEFSDSDSDKMVPQGLCIAEGYMLVSAYDKSGRENSVIYILSNEDAQNRELLTTIILPDKNHVGGLAWDGSSLWVAKSTDKCLARIAGGRISSAVQDGQAASELESYDEVVSCGVTASFVSYQDGRLWVGTSHTLIGECGRLSVFVLEEGEEETNLIRQFTMKIPDHAQGIAFFEENEVQYLLISTSAGRYGDSRLYLYTEEISDEKAALYYVADYNLPPMAEEVVGSGAFTYCLFESAATCYSMEDGFSCPYPVDRICALSNTVLVRGADKKSD
ncbi:MAG: hypothetical protein LUD14_01395 [Clostridiales bacterium]|nr:hypothetical protein [Clostridiales bacterium]